MTVVIAIGVWVIALTLIWVLYNVVQAREEIREIKHWAMVMDNTMARFTRHQPLAGSRPAGQVNKTMEH